MGSRAVTAAPALACASRMITYSVFRLAARCTDLCGWIPRMECAPVSEKRVGLNRSPVARVMGVECPRTFAGGAPGHPGWRPGAIRRANQTFEPGPVSQEGGRPTLHPTPSHCPLTAPQLMRPAAAGVRIVLKVLGGG